MDAPYRQVKKTNTLRCGYMIWPPFISQDPNTKEISGFFKDYLEELAKGYGWKVSWAEEIGSSDMAAALDAGRVDMICGAPAITQQMSSAVYFSQALFWIKPGIYSRNGDLRFDNNYKALNNPQTILSTIEGDGGSKLVKKLFPEVTLLEIPAHLGPVQLIQNVLTKKADAVVLDPFTFNQFDENNPNQMHAIPGIDVGAIPVAFPIKFGASKFKWLVDMAVFDLQTTRFTSLLAQKYQLDKYNFYIAEPNLQKVGSMDAN